MIFHKRASTVFQNEIESDDLSFQIDLLNQELDDVVKDIEISNISNSPSRMSALTFDFLNNNFHQDDQMNEELRLNYELAIESLLTSLDRHQMVIEDFCSEENRKNGALKNFCKSCLESAEGLRRDIWSEFSQKKTEKNKKEKDLIEEKIKGLEKVKSEYLEKIKDLMSGVEMLRVKEKLLSEKEKELRAQRLEFDKQKTAWEKENGIETRANPVGTDRHVRASSFSYLEVFCNQVKGLKRDCFKQEQVSKLKEELKSLLNETEDNGKNVRIENLKNLIARLRADIALNESNRATKFISSIMNPVRREPDRRTEIKRIELLENKAKNTDFPVSAKICVKDKAADFKRLYFAASVINEKEVSDNRSRDFKDLGKGEDLTPRELFFQRNWKRAPGDKELTDNTNMNSAKLTKEKMMFERE